MKDLPKRCHGEINLIVCRPIITINVAERQTEIRQLKPLLI
jgi:hypothetical protein